MKSWHLALMFALLIVGIALHSVRAFAIIHEAFHYSKAFHDNVDVLGYTRTSVTVERYTRGIILNGHWGELFIWTGLALMLGRWGTLFAGYGAAGAVAAPHSFDFTVALARWAEQRGATPIQIEEVVALNIRNFTMVAIICGIMLFIRYAHLLSKLRESAPMSETVRRAP